MSHSAALPSIHQLRKNTQWLELSLFVISRKNPMQYITWMNFYFMANTLKVAVKALENGHFWVHKNMHFPKDWTITSALQLPLQFYTCKATSQKFAAPTNNSRFALMGAGEMFIHKKRGCLLKITLKCCKSQFSNVLEQQCHLQYSFSYSWGKDKIFKLLRSLHPSAALMKFPITIVKSWTKLPWRTFSFKSFPRTEVIVPATH